MDIYSIFIDSSIATADPYCVIKWDKGKAVTPWIEQNLNPNWGERVTCYHKNTKTDITIEVIGLLCVCIYMDIYLYN